MAQQQDETTEREAATGPARRPRILRWLAGGALAVLLVLGAVLLGLNTPIGKRFIADQIAQFAPASGLRFEVGRIEGDIYGAATLHDLTLLDPKGEFLTFSEVELDWRPLSWITSGLDIETLIARRGTLQRLPELLPGDPDAPTLPAFDIHIGDLQIRDLTLAEGIVGDSAPVIDLMASADIRDGRAYVKAEGDLGDEDRLALLLDAEPDGDRFDLDLDYNAPAGGVMARLIGAETGSTLRIAGDGTWAKWDGYAYATRGGERLGAFRLANREGRYSLSGQAFPQDLLAGIPARALGQAVSIGAVGTLEESVFSGEIAMRGAGLRAMGGGEVDLAGNRIDGFELVANLLDPQLLGEGVRLQETRLTATLDGAFRDLSIDHALSIADADLSGVALANVQQSGTATYDGTRWILPLAVTAERVDSGIAYLENRLVDGTLDGTLVLSGSRLLADDLRLAFPDLSAQLALNGDLDTGRYQLTGPVEAQGLALDNVGILNGTAQIDLDLRDTGVWALRTQIDARIPQVTNETLANLAGSDIRARGAVSLGSGSPVDFRGLSVSAQKLSLTLDGRVAGDTTTLAGRGRHVEYGPFTVEAALRDSGPTATLVFADPLPAAGLKDVRVAISPTEQGFAIQTEGDSLLGDFAGSLGLIAPADGPTRIDVEQLRVWKTAVSGNLVLAEGGADGALFLSGGGLDGRIGLAARGGGQGFAFDIDANRAQFGGDTPLSIANAQLEGKGFLQGGNSTVEANIMAQGLSYGGLFIGRLAAATELENGRGTATASLAGRRGSRFNLQLNADIAPERIAVASRGEFAGKAIRLPRRAVLTRQDAGGWALARTVLQYGEGAAVVSGEFGGERLAAKLALDDMPLSLVDLALADFGLGGTISGEVDFATNEAGQLVGSTRVAVNDLTRSGLVLTSKPIDLALVSDLSANALDLRAVLKEGGARRGRIQARVSNLAPSGSLMQRLQNGSLKAGLRFNGPAAALWRLAAVEAFDLTGPVAVAANVTGTWSNPRVIGSLASDDLRVQSALSGTDIRNVSARGRFAGSRLRLTRFAGETANGGRVSGSGIIDLEGLGPKGPSLDIKVAADRARLLNANGIDATISGPLRIVSDGNGGTIAGRVRINRASWKLGTADEAVDLPQIETREINIPADIAPPRVRQKAWRYLIDARGDSRIDVDGMGLDSEWGADIILRGTTSDPRIGGQAQVVRGSYSFAGTRFELTRGRINFDANVPIDPRLDIRAETEADGLDVAVSVRGNAQTPEITFSSTPALPEEEVLARLLFGGSITDLSATDALQLGTALASLRGGSGLDPINRLRSAIGLDRLRIVGADPALNRGTGVAVGKNIGRKFYVELITDGRGYSATEAEFRVTSWLSLLASVSTIGRESVVAEISRDY